MADAAEDDEQVEDAVHPAALFPLAVEHRARGVADAAGQQQRETAPPDGAGRCC